MSQNLNAAQRSLVRLIWLDHIYNNYAKLLTQYYRSGGKSMRDALSICNANFIIVMEDFFTKEDHSYVYYDSVEEIRERLLKMKSSLRAVDELLPDKGELADERNFAINKLVQDSGIFKR